MSGFKNTFVSAILVDDSDDEPIVEYTPIINPIVKPMRKPRKEQIPLKAYSNPDINITEVGIDEAGRGPLFGRVYVGAVALPKDSTFNHGMMKDSKKFTSNKKIEEAEAYIKENAIAWSVEYEDEVVIDDINILQATQSAMHKAANSIQRKMDINNNNIFLLVDGNYFKPYYSSAKYNNGTYDAVKCATIEKGDNTYSSIAAASILAKVARDRYIAKLCEENPELIEHYAINSNKGYGAKVHREGIMKHGITKWHRRTFGICKNYA